MSDYVTIYRELEEERALADEMADLLGHALFAGRPKELIDLTDRRDAALARWRKARGQ